MHGIKVWSDDVTTTYTDRQFYPGTLRVQHEVEVHEDARDVGNPAATFTPYGEREWVFVYNGSGATISAGTVVVRDGTDPWNGKAAAGTEVAGNVLGIAQHDIADGSYGWVLRKGVGYAIPTAAIADGASFLAAVKLDLP